MATVQAPEESVVRRLPSHNDRRKSDTRPTRPTEPTAATWPGSLRRFENQILALIDVWAYPSGNAWLLHDDGTIIEIPNNTPSPTEVDDGFGAMRHAHTRVPLVGQWSIVVGGVNKQDIERFTNAVEMLARLARQQGELEATTGVAMETSEEVAALRHLISVRTDSLERPAVLNYLAQTILKTAISAAVLIIDEHGSTFSAGTTAEVTSLTNLVTTRTTAAIVRTENTETPFDYVTKRVADDTTVVAIAGLPGVSITSSQLRYFDHATSHADGVLRLMRLTEVGR